jgi:hypothetical protein
MTDSIDTNNEVYLVCSQLNLFEELLFVLLVWGMKNKRKAWLRIIVPFILSGLIVWGITRDPLATAIGVLIALLLAAATFIFR